MANNLNRIIQPGELLVQTKESVKPEYQSIEHRIFVAESGFGLSPFTSGTKIFGHYQNDGEESYIRGYDISVEETIAIQNPSPQ